MMMMEFTNTPSKRWEVKNKTRLPNPACCVRRSRCDCICLLRRMVARVILAGGCDDNRVNDRDEMIRALGAKEVKDE